MTRQSPLTIHYPDLLHLSEEVLQERTARLEGARGRGTRNLDPLIKSVEAAKTLARMLRKGLKEKQTDLFGLFEQVKK